MLKKGAKEKTLFSSALIVSTSGRFMYKHEFSGQKIRRNTDKISVLNLADPGVLQAFKCQVTVSLGETISRSDGW